MVERPIPQEARDAADMLLATVGCPPGFTAEHDVSARAGAAMALIADNANTRLKQLSIPEEAKAVAYFKAIGGAVGMTVKFSPEETRPAVAAALFFYMAEFLCFNSQTDTAEFLDAFADRLDFITQAAVREGFI